MNIEAIRTLLVTAEHRNYRKVAEVMHISQPAISKRIRVLEDHFGNSLVERVGASMVLTPAGQALLPYFERIVSTFDEASQRLIEPENWRGSIRLGAVDTILSTWLTDFLDQHRKRHPKIKFEVITAPTHELLEDIKQGRIDIALMLGPSYDRALMEVPLCVMDVGFYGKRNEQLVKGEGPRRLTFSEVSESTIITFPNGSRPYFEIVEKLRALRLPKMPVVSGCTSLFTMRQMAERDLGVISLPTAMAEESNLERLDLGIELAEMQFAAVYEPTAAPPIYALTCALAQETAAAYARISGGGIRVPK